MDGRSSSSKATKSNQNDSEAEEDENLAQITQQPPPQPPPSAQFGMAGRKCEQQVIVRQQKSEQIKYAKDAKEPVAALSKRQMKDFRDTFRLLDKDGDGSITKDELIQVMRGFGQFALSKEMQLILQDVDADGDGKVSLEEFIRNVSKLMVKSEEEEKQELMDAFRVFDKHNRGYITASDLRAVLQCLGEDLSEDEIEDMIREVDVDGDGRIDFFEFARSLGEPDECSDEEEEESK